MGKSVRLSQDEAARRVAAAGYVLVGTYLHRHKPVAVRCARHGDEYGVRLANLSAGGRLRCCAQESRRKALSVAMSGSGNHFYGRHHSDETRAVLRAKNSGINNPRTGKPRPSHEIEATRRALLGRSRSEETRKKLSDHITELTRSVDYFISRAATGKTSGRAGMFYIIRDGLGLLKFGSLVRMTIKQRMRYIRTYTGSAELVICARVPDAGAYEAEMMDRYRAHWARGECFHDFLGAPA